jgi:hypothetical protein
MKLITTLLIASAFAAHANWFTELFESDIDKQVRQEKELVELRAFLQEAQAEHDRKYGAAWEYLHRNCSFTKGCVAAVAKKERCSIGDPDAKAPWY